MRLGAKAVKISRSIRANCLPVILTGLAIFSLVVQQTYAQSSNPTLAGTLGSIGEGTSSTISDVTSVIENGRALGGEAYDQVLSGITFNEAGLPSGVDTSSVEGIRAAVDQYGPQVMGAAGNIADTVQFVQGLDVATVQNLATDIAVNEGTQIAGQLLASMPVEQATAAYQTINEVINDPIRGAELAAEFTNFATPQQVQQAIGLVQDPASAIPLVAGSLDLPFDAAALANDPAGYAANFAQDVLQTQGAAAAQQVLGALGAAGGDLADIGGEALNNLIAGGDLDIADAGALIDNLLATDPVGALGLISGLEAGDPLVGALEGALSPESLASLDALTGGGGLAALASGGGAEILAAFGLTGDFGGLAGSALGAVAGAVLGIFGAAICNCLLVLPYVQQLHEITEDYFFNEATPAADSELELTQLWMVETWFLENWLPMLMTMTEQLNVAMEMQTNMIGQFLDAKHQLETQRLFQELQAQAHKDYHPSEGMCTIGTNVRSLASSERYADLSTTAIANHTMQRQLLSGEKSTKESSGSDAQSRLTHYRNLHCNVADNNNGLEFLCQADQPARQNKDVDFTRTMETVLTLDMDFTAEGAGPPTPDEEDVFALASNLYASKPLPYMKDTWMSNEATNRNEGDSLYLDVRSIAAKRSVAMNSFATIAGMKTSGAPEVQPFLYAVVQDLGLPDEEIIQILGERPSYFAQMEVLTKKLYQNPNFYTNLYDKPVNVSRKAAALQAIGLMQDRDIYKTLIRSEALLSVLLEMKLIKEQERISSEIDSAVRGTAEQQGAGE